MKTFKYLEVSAGEPHWSLGLFSSNLNGNVTYKKAMVGLVCPQCLLKEVFTTFSKLIAVVALTTAIAILFNHLSGIGRVILFPFLIVCIRFLLIHANHTYRPLVTIKSPELDKNKDGSVWITTEKWNWLTSRDRTLCSDHLFVQILVFKSILYTLFACLLVSGLSVVF